MRLLNTVTLQFKQFFDVDIPDYAILSHRWEPPDSIFREYEFEEFDALPLSTRLSLQRLDDHQLRESDILSTSHPLLTLPSPHAQHDDDNDDPSLSHPQSARGLKIGQFSSIAQRHGFAWIWIDTICIDKRNSAELTEAINSMFRWYARARRCYVYFNDVTWDESSPSTSHAQLVASRWFTRGWTLQELLAPRSLQCYDRGWVRFGDRTSLAGSISLATGISEVHLHDQRTASVAMKMSWASVRETSRVEDVAYSLLGLFDINMPMLYGEGANAFERLQRKIIKKTADETIFAWSHPLAFKPHGMLAPSPAAFAGCGGLVTVPDDVAAPRRPYSMTNKGLEFFVNLPMEEGGEKRYTDSRSTTENKYQTLILGLNCERQQVPVGQKGRYLAIMLERFGDCWRRVRCDEECVYKDRVETVFYLGSRVLETSQDTQGPQAIYIKQDK